MTTLTKTISSSSVVKYFGVNDTVTCYVYDTNSSTWESSDSIVAYTITEYLNQPTEFNATFEAITDTEKVYIKENSHIMFFYGLDQRIFRGIIQKVTYGTAWNCEAKGIGEELRILNKEFIKDNDKRIQYTNTSAKTIAQEMLALNSTTTSPNYIITPTTSGLFSSDWGDYSMRVEYGNRLKSIAELANGIKYDWWVNCSATLNPTTSDDRFNIASLKGTSTPVMAFCISGSNSNANMDSKETDTGYLVNYVDILGYGDGINQLHTFTYAAADNISGTLSSSMNATQTKINISSTTGFSDGDIIRIAEEQINVATVSATQFTGCVRGTNSTTAKVHQKGVYYEKYFAYTSPTTDSSLATYGQMDNHITDRTLIDITTAEKIASDYLLDHKDPIVRIRLNTSDPMSVLQTIQVGDYVTVTDAEAGITGSYRIIGFIFTGEYGMLNLELELSNKTENLLAQLSRERDQAETMQKYMTGATNIYQISTYENADGSNYLNLRFYAPDDLIAMNTIKASFRLLGFRAYSIAAGSEPDKSRGTQAMSFDWDPAEGDSGCLGLAIDDVQSGGTFSTHVWKYAFIDRSNLSATRYFRLATGSAVDVSSGAGTTVNNIGSFNLAYRQGIAGSFIDTTDRHDDTGWFQVSDTSDFDSGGVGYGDEQIIGIDTLASHGHQTGFAITTQSLSATASVALYAGEEGSETFVGTYSNTINTNIDLTTSMGTLTGGNWYNVQFRPNNEMRVEANAYVKCFIQSRD